MAQAHVDERQGRGADQRRAQELAELPQKPGAGDGGGDPQAGHCLLRPGERRPETIHPVVRELAADATRPMPVATGCGVLGVSTSGYHAGDTRRLSGRDLEQAHLMAAIRDAHAACYGTYETTTKPQVADVGLGGGT